MTFISEVLRAIVQSKPDRFQRRRKSSSAVFAAVDCLESRQLLTAVTMSDHEQLLLELVNRARMNPSAEAARYGINLNDNLAPGTITSDPKQPLAPHQSLIDAAGKHSQDMINRSFFSHTNPDLLTPAQRAQAEGYPTSAVGENIARHRSTGPLDEDQLVYDQHEGLFRSEGHRENMLHPPYEEVGLGIRSGQMVEGATTYNARLVTEKFGIRGVNAFITGVVFNDSNADKFYGLGEAIRSGTVTATETTSGAIYTTDIGVSGGYGMIVPDGTYTVVASFQLAGTPYTGTSSVTVTSSNVKVDFRSQDASSAALLVTPGTAALRETGSPTTTLLTVSRTGPTTAAVTVTLSSSDTSEVTLPASVTIPAGSASAQVTVTAAADNLIDGNQVATLSASAIGLTTGTTTVTVADTSVPSFPTSTVNTNQLRPTITWNGLANASSYVIWVDNASTGARQVIYQEGIVGTSFTPATDLPISAYRVWVRGVAAGGGISGWSAAQIINVRTPPVVNGHNSTISSNTYTFSWNNLPGAATYDVWVNQLSTSTSQYIRNTAVAQNSLTVADLPVGRYGIWVRGINSAGFGSNWSGMALITVSLPPASLDVSAATLTDRTTVSWNALAGVSTYHVWVNNQSTGASAVVNQSGIATTSYQLPVLPAAAYAVWVRGVDANGHPYAWSPVLQFDIQKSARILTPAKLEGSQTPLFSWTTVSGASRYEIWVSSLDGAGRVIYDANVLTNSFSATTPLASGNYRYWVRAFDATNANTGWSGSYDFTITRTNEQQPSQLPEVLPANGLLPLNALTAEAATAAKLIDLVFAEPADFGDSRRVDSHPVGESTAEEYVSHIPSADTRATTAITQGEDHQIPTTASYVPVAAIVLEKRHS